MQLTLGAGSAINGIQTAPSQSTNSGDGSLHLSNAKQSTEAQRSTAAQRSSRTAAALTPTSSPTSKGDGGLSTGAAIGIGVAISVFAIVTLLAIAFFWCKRRSRRRQRGDRNVGNDQRDSRRDAKGAAAVREKKTKTGDDPVVSPYELSGKSRTGELETSANRHELDARQRAERRHELEGDYGERKAVQNLR